MSEKRISIIVYILIFVLIILIILAVTNWKSGILSNKYVYTNPKGEDFTFNKVKIENLTLHVLTAYVEDKTGVHQYTIPFRNNPNDLEKIYLEPNIKDKILTKKGIYTTLDPNLKGEAVVAAIEISRIIGTNDYGVFKIPTQSATTIPTNTTYPIITCNNATKELGVILFELGDETKIYSDNECVIVEGNTYSNLIKAADRLALHLVNVM